VRKRLQVQGRSGLAKPCLNKPKAKTKNPQLKYKQGAGDMAQVVA
jgi:hypothetical protein